MRFAQCTHLKLIKSLSRLGRDFNHYYLTHPTCLDQNYLLMSMSSSLLSVSRFDALLKITNRCSRSTTLRRQS